MNILFLANHLNTGGITSYMRTLGGGLVRRGHRVFIASSGGELAAQLAGEGISIWKVPLRTKSEVDPRILVSFFIIAWRMRNEGIHLVHANTRVTQALASLLQRYCRVPFVSTCHGFFKPSAHRKSFPYWGRKVVAISSQVEEHLRRDLNVPAGQIELIHNGIDVKRFSAPPSADKMELKRRFGVGEGPVVGIIARLSEVKGHKYLLEAMQEVCRDIPQASLLVAGEGGIQPQLSAQAASLGIAGRVFFFKNCQDTRDLLSAMDVFAMPSLHEGLGLGLMEAMASGVAVVGSAVGGIQTLIAHGKTGLLVPAKDPHALAKALTTLLRDPGQRQALAAAGREFIAAHFSQDEMVERTERMYLQCA